MGEPCILSTQVQDRATGRAGAIHDASNRVSLAVAAPAVAALAVAAPAVAALAVAAPAVAAPAVATAVAATSLSPPPACFRRGPQCELINPPRPQYNPRGPGAEK